MHPRKRPMPFPMRVTRMISVTMIVPALLALTGSLTAGPARDPVLLFFASLVEGTVVEETFTALGVRFRGEAGSPTMRLVDPVSLVPTAYAIRNEPFEGTSAGKDLILQFTEPVSRVFMTIGGGSPGATARLRLYDASARLLGELERDEIEGPVGPGIAFETEDPEGVSIAVLSYGDDEAPEQINSLRFDPISERPYRSCIPVLAHGSAGGRSARTILQIHFFRDGTRGQLNVFDPEGNPLALRLNGTVASSFALEEIGLVQWMTEGTAEGLVSGYACLDTNFPAVANAIIEFFEGNRVTNRAGVAGQRDLRGGVRLRVAVEREVAVGLGTAFALVNPTDQDAIVRLRPTLANRTQPDGLVNTPMLMLAARGQRTFFLRDLCGFTVPDFPDFIICREDFLADDFLGFVTITSDQPVIVTVLRTINGLPVANLAVGSFTK